MSLPIRLAKLRFIVQDLELAQAMARHLCTDFSKRTLVRHVLVRAENFVAHARDLRGDLGPAGMKSRPFHKAKEEYARQFGEYFEVTRNKIAAHVQDLDFGVDLTLWNDIDVVKSEFFVESALQIYRDLERAQVADLPPYVSHPDLASIVEIGAVLASADDEGSALRIGTDPLAASRPNTAAVFTFGPLQGRAGQLVLISQWIDLERRLVAQLAGHPNASRIIKTRMVTDVVSYGDCLVTRHDPSGHAPRGLFDLFIDEGCLPESLAKFMRSFRFAPALEELRAVRNAIGGHVEIDPVVTVAQLERRLDDLPAAVVEAFFDEVRRAFDAACREDGALALHTSSGVSLTGISVSQIPGGRADFDSRSPEVVKPVELVADWSSRLVFDAMLGDWIAAGPKAGSARSWFYHAFNFAEVRETVADDPNIRRGRAVHTTQLRAPHLWLLEMLLAERDPARLRRMLLLTLGCSKGDPKALAEVMDRYRTERGPEASAMCDHWRLIRLIGELGDWVQRGIVGRLEEIAATGEDQDRREAVVALFKMFIETAEFERHRRRELDAEEVAVALQCLGAVAPRHRLLGLLQCASYLAKTVGLGRNCRGEAEFVDWLLRGELDHWPDPARGAERMAMLDQHEFMGLAWSLAQPEAATAPELRDFLARAVSEDALALGRSPVARECCSQLLYVAKDYGTALELTEALANEYPHEPAVRLMHLDMQAACGVAAPVLLAELTNVETRFNLGASEIATVQRLRQRLERPSP